MLLALYQSTFEPVAGARHQKPVWGKLLFEGVSFVQLEQVDKHRNVDPRGSSLQLPKLRPKDPNSVTLAYTMKAKMKPPDLYI